MKSLRSLSDVLVCAFLIVVTVGIGTTVFRSGPKDLRASTTRNLGKVGQACNLYAVDHGGRYPMSMSANTATNSWRIGGRAPAGWSGPPHSLEPRLTEDGSFWANSLLPYGVSQTGYQIAGAQSLSSLVVPFPLARPMSVGISMNGLAHTFSQSEVSSPGFFPTFWTSNGRRNTVGIATSNPTLNCITTLQPCLYVATRPPQSGTSGAAIMWFPNGCPQSTTVSHRVHGLDGLYVTQDGSVRPWPMGLVSAPDSTDPSLDPWTSYRPGGVCAQSIWVGPNGYPWLFRPNYAP